MSIWDQARLLRSKKIINCVNNLEPKEGLSQLTRARQNWRFISIISTIFLDKNGGAKSQVKACLTASRRQAKCYPPALANGRKSRKVVPKTPIEGSS